MRKTFRPCFPESRKATKTDLRKTSLPKILMPLLYNKRLKPLENKRRKLQTTLSLKNCLLKRRRKKKNL